MTARTWLSIIGYGSIIVFLGLLFLNVYMFNVTKQLSDTDMASLMKIAPTDILYGNSNSDNMLVIWIDYENMRHPELIEQVRENIIPVLGKHIMVAYKDIPAPNSTYGYEAALAVRCAAIQNKGHRAQAYAIDARKPFSIVDIDRMPNAISGLNESVWNTCRTDEYMRAELNAEIALGYSYGIKKTPYVILNGSELDADEMTVSEIQSRL